jgi:hypothetical protein
MNSAPRSPPRRILICAEQDGGWLTIAGSHGWLFGSLTEARREALWLADNLGLPVCVLLPLRRLP